MLFYNDEMARAKKKKVNIEAKRRAGLKGGPETKKRMLARDPEWYSKISKMRTTFSGGRKAKPKKRTKA